MVSFTSLLTLAASVSAVAVPQPDAYTVTFAKRDTCEIINFDTLLTSVNSIVGTLLGLTDLSADAALINTLVGDIQTILGTIDDQCLGEDLNALVGTLTSALDSLLAAL